MSSDRRAVVIGKDNRLEGLLDCREDILVEGYVRGQIFSNQTVTVGPSAQVIADITAGKVVIHGRVSGNILAAELIEIGPTGDIEGSLRAARIRADQGATFRGSLDVVANPDAHAESKPGGDKPLTLVESPTARSGHDGQASNGRRFELRPPTAAGTKSVLLKLDPHS